jgi:hypothetical protein
MTATGTAACFAIPYIILDTDSSTTLNRNAYARVSSEQQAAAHT